MQLLRISDGTRVSPAAIDPQGGARLLADWLPDLTDAALERGALDRLGRRFGAEYADLPVARWGHVRVLPPVLPRQIVSIGLNYRSHAVEAGLDLPQEPVVATKSPLAVAGPYDEIPIPPHAQSVDWEVELGVVIGRRVQYLSGPEESADCIAGYCIGNDLSDRDWLLSRGGQWVKGKSFEGFAPIGPWLVTPDELEEVHDLPLRCWVNGRLMQDGTTADMRFGADQLVHYLSQFMVLAPGDVILTGSPAGNALSHPDHPYLRPGDTVRAAIGGLGVQEQTCLAARAGARAERPGGEVAEPA